MRFFIAICAFLVGLFPALVFASIEGGVRVKYLEWPRIPIVDLAHTPMQDLPFDQQVFVRGGLVCTSTDALQRQVGLLLTYKMFATLANSDEPVSGQPCTPYHYRPVVILGNADYTISWNNGSDPAMPSLQVMKIYYFEQDSTFFGYLIYP